MPLRQAPAHLTTPLGAESVASMRRLEGSRCEIASKQPWETSNLGKLMALYVGESWEFLASSCGQRLGQSYGPESKLK